jgi:flagellar basal-body rod modification protein FlgD
MTVPSVSATTTPDATGSAAKPDSLGRDAFLSLLVTQLEHQNPLEPQPDGEFLAQLAQFSSLESLQQMKDDISALRTMAEDSAAVKQASSSTTSNQSPVSTGGL